MHKPYDMVRGCVRTYPLPLLAVKDEKLLDVANSYLPYSTGIEIETRDIRLNQNVPYYEYEKVERSVVADYKQIPDIMDVRIDSGEQRFRIPSGVNGMICLYRICNHLKKNSFLNTQSGIHYHIDVSQYKDLFFDRYLDGKHSVTYEHRDWVLKALDSWGYKGSYNAREFRASKGGWIGLRGDDFKTIEIRIGEMSFEYSVLINRIIHAQRIVKRLVSLLSLKSPLVKDESASKIFTTERRLVRRGRTSLYDGMFS